MPYGLIEETSGGSLPRLPEEKDPSGRVPHSPGAKLDDGKAPIWRGLLDYFPRALRAVSLVSLFGSEKYLWKGWESVPDGVNRYTDAMGRHLIDLSTGDYAAHDHHLMLLLGDVPPEMAHRAQIAWNALAALELALREREPTKSPTQAHEEFMTKRAVLYNPTPGVLQTPAGKPPHLPAGNDVKTPETT